MCSEILSISQLKLIIGRLKAVGNLTSTSTVSALRLIWEPPFSLNLTTVDPDIAYCVDIFNITAGFLSSNHLISDCNVFEPHYIFVLDHPDSRDQFHFIVVPRSNVEGARNGTPNEIIGTYQNSFDNESKLIGYS